MSAEVGGLIPTHWAANIGGRAYSPWGEVKSSTGAWQGPFGYGASFGYQSDPNGLQLLGHRYYDPAAGRFLSPDPIQDGGNWYAYVGNSPVSYTDPWGLVRIEARYRVAVSRAAVTFYHWYIVVIDNMKEGSPIVATFGAGPERNDRNDPGNLVMKDDEYDQQVDGGVVLVDNDKPAQPYIDKLNAIERRLVEEDVPYSIAELANMGDSQNSNTYVAAMLHAMNLYDEFLIANSKRHPIPKFRHKVGTPLRPQKRPGGIVVVPIPWSPGMNNRPGRWDWAWSRQK